jgi:Gpi18-like mannosyltransferase
MTAHAQINGPANGSASALASFPLQFALVAALSIYLQALCWSTVPPDMRLFLFPWYDHLVSHGPLGAFAAPFSNYTPPYLYLLAAGTLADGLLTPLTIIKLLSLAGTLFLAWSVAEVLKALRADPKGTLLLFLLPTAVLNSALLGQCDALWAGACVLAVAAMIRGRTIACLVWCGVAIAFKAQAAFIAPFVIGALIGRRAPLWTWAVPPLVYAGLMLPAWLLGWPAADLATVYLRQAGWFATPGNLANPWVWASALDGATAQSLFPLGYAAAAAAAVAVGVLAARSVHRPRALLVVATLSALAIPFLLPKMHERYFFLADVLALALALAVGGRRSAAIAAAVQLASLLALASYIYNWPALVMAAPLVAAAALAGLAVLFHHLAASHDEGDGLEHPDVAQRVPGDRDQIGALAGLNGSDVLR